MTFHRSRTTLVLLAALVVLAGPGWGRAEAPDFAARIRDGQNTPVGACSKA